jgi:hypothetical protein
MASMFDQQKISYALERFADFINESGSGAVPGWADHFGKVIFDSLQAYSDKLREHGFSDDVRDSHVGLAIYAYFEPQAFVTRDKSDIPNRSAARVYRHFLETRLEELRKQESELGA